MMFVSLMWHMKKRFIFSLVNDLQFLMTSVREKSSIIMDRFNAQ